jgi:hypothetical protein
MSNKAKRAKLAKRLKELGMGKLYKGNKKVAWRMLNSTFLNNMLWKLQFSPGDIVNDCDAANHVIVKWPYSKRTFRQWLDISVKGWVIEVAQFEDQDGRWSCGCPYQSPEKALSREEVEGHFRKYLNDNELKELGYLEHPRYKRMSEAFANGQHIADERGILLKEFAYRPEE